jgi:hypothetical protein
VLRNFFLDNGNGVELTRRRCDAAVVMDGAAWSPGRRLNGEGERQQRRNAALP